MWIFWKFDLVYFILCLYMLWLTIVHVYIYAINTLANLCSPQDRKYSILPPKHTHPFPPLYLLFLLTHFQEHSLIGAAHTAYSRLWEQNSPLIIHPGSHVVPSDGPSVTSIHNAIVQQTSARFWAFDFDGVVCHSAQELGMSGWRGLRSLVPGLPTDMSDSLLSQWLQVRNVLEFGFESLVMLHALHVRGVTVEFMLENGPGTDHERGVLGVSEKELKDSFTQARLEWIEDDFEGWLGKFIRIMCTRLVPSISLYLIPLFSPFKFPDSHSFYPLVVKALQDLIMAGERVYIITTKQAEFAHMLLARANLAVPKYRVFGLGMGQKEEVLDMLCLERENGAPYFFIEVRMV